MINPLSNQYYSYPYTASQVVQPVKNTVVAQPQTEGYLSLAGAKEAKRNQELGPKECKT